MHVRNGDARPALHEYNPAQFDDARSPCPALNALANHSYLPHGGREVSFWTSVRALREVYNLSLLLAAVLTLAGCLLCGRGLRLSYSLDDLAAHGPHTIEHDGSLSRPDATPPNARTAPWQPDPARVEELSPSASSFVTLDDLCRVRRARDRALTRPLGAFHAEIARGEVALAHALFAEPDADGAVPAARLRAWFAQDRLLEWRRPPRTIGLFEAVRRAREVRRRVAALAKSE